MHMRIKLSRRGLIKGAVGANLKVFAGVKKDDKKRSGCVTATSATITPVNSIQYRPI